MMRKRFKALLNSRVILDTNSIIDLQELKILDLPTRIFSEVYISDNILVEELSAAHGKDLLQLGYKPISLKANNGFGLLSNLSKNNKSLSIPDKVVISIAYENNIVCCTNDKAARIACKSINIEVIGTIGMLCCAYENSIIERKDFEYIFNNYFAETSSFINYSLETELRTIYSIPMHKSEGLKSIQ